MSIIPKNLKYQTTHEWAVLEDDGLVSVGISDFAQDQLGDLVFLELPEIGEEYTAGLECAVVESVKAASDLYAPIAGTIIAINAALIDEPELINDDSYANWLFKLKPNNLQDLEDLMDATAYEAMLHSED